MMTQFKNCRFSVFWASGLLVILLSLAIQVKAQEKALTNNSKSPFAKLYGVDMGSVSWTNGFWAERFKVATETIVPNMWDVYNDPKISHAFKNFEIAAGLDTGRHRGPSFHDGDYYKTLEAMASLYASTGDPALLQKMDNAIAVISKSQREDGYIYTKAMIEQRKTGSKNQFQDRLSFESYNIGHLMTAACVHYRATGQSNLLDVAKKATEYLYGFYKKASPTLARNAICPSHYMGVIEMFRTLRDPRYLELAKHLIAIKGKIDDGTDDNQDRIPFLKQIKATGHAVRASYLYAGVADLYAETGNDSLMKSLNLMWNDVNSHKMYVTGGLGSLYDGTSPDGTSYNPTEVQKIPLTVLSRCQRYDLRRLSIEEILTLFKEFVHQNRPSLDIDEVATGETWFGSAAMDKGLCDEIRAVDDVLLDHVKNGYQVLDVKYTPPKEKESLKQLLGVRGGKEQKSLVGKAVQWFVQTVASEIKAELEDSRGIQQKYMMKDDTKDRYRL